MEKDVILENIRHNYTLLEYRLKAIFAKLVSSYNEYDKKIIKKFASLTGLPTLDLPTDWKFEEILSEISQSQSRLNEYDEWLEQILELAISSEKEEEEKKKRSKNFHWATLSEDELGILERKFWEIWWMSSKKSTSFWKWKRLSQEQEKFKEEKTSNDVKKIRDLYSELEPHLVRIYNKFPRNRNERDKSVIVKVSALFRLRSLRRPKNNDLEKLIQKTAPVDLQTIEDSISEILSQAIAAWEIDTQWVKSSMKYKKNVWKLEQKEREKLEFEKDFYEYNDSYMDKMLNSWMLSVFASDERKNAIKVYEEKKRIFEERKYAENKIKKYKSLRKKEKWARHLASLAKTDMTKLEKVLEDIWGKQVRSWSKKRSKWERIKSELVKEYDQKRKEAENAQAKHDKLKKKEKEARHSAALAEVDLLKMDEKFNALAWDSESVEGNTIKKKWERLKDEQKKVKKSWYFSRRRVS